MEYNEKKEQQMTEVRWSKEQQGQVRKTGSSNKQHAVAVKTDCVVSKC